MMFKENDIVFLKSECGDLTHSHVPINKLCMVKKNADKRWCSIVKVEKQCKFITTESYAYVDDLVLFEPQAK